MMTEEQVNRAHQLLDEMKKIREGHAAYQLSLKSYVGSKMKIKSEVSILLTGPGRCTSFAVLPVDEATINALVVSRLESIKMELSNLGVTS